MKYPILLLVAVVFCLIALFSWATSYRTPRRQKDLVRLMWYGAALILVAFAAVLLAP